MNQRMEQILNDFENNKLNADDSFKFHCTQCGKCCINRDDILLSPQDLFRIAKKLDLTPTDTVNQYCEAYIGNDSRIPVVRIKSKGSIQRCPFLKDRKCSVHEAKPAVCAMFPIGRAVGYSKDPDSEMNTVPKLEYFFTDPGCGDNAETHTLKEWFHDFGLSLEDDYFIRWALFQMELHDFLADMEKHVDESLMKTLWNSVFIQLYLDYDIKKEFLPQFDAHVDKIHLFLQSVFSE